jgi:hypothetical protein
VVLGGQLSYNDMVACSGPLGDDEQSRQFDPIETTRFGFYARLLWDALLGDERLVTR